MCIYGQRDLSVMDFWRDKYVTCVCPPKVSWSYRYDKSLLCHLFLKLLAAWKMCRLKKSSKDGVLTDISLENPVTDIWKFEYSKKGTPDTCMETTLWDLELILSWKWAKWVSTATCRAGKKSMKIQSSMRSRELSWQNFQITFWHFLLLF